MIALDLSRIGDYVTQTTGAYGEVLIKQVPLAVLKSNYGHFAVVFAFDDVNSDVRFQSFSTVTVVLDKSGAYVGDYISLINGNKDLGSFTKVMRIVSLGGQQPTATLTSIEGPNFPLPKSTDRECGSAKLFDLYIAPAPEPGSIYAVLESAHAAARPNFAANMCALRDSNGNGE